LELEPFVQPWHFASLLKSSIILPSKVHVGTPNEWKKIKHVYSANQLSEKNIKFGDNPNEDLT